MISKTGRPNFFRFVEATVTSAIDREHEYQGVVLGTQMELTEQVFGMENWWGNIGEGPPVGSTTMEFVKITAAPRTVLGN